MIKINKKIIYFLLILLIVQSQLVIASGRMNVLGDGLKGIVEDQRSEIKLNPAQLYNITNNKVFLDTELNLSLNPNLNDELKENRLTREVLINPTLIYQWDSNNTLGLDFILDHNFYLNRYEYSNNDTEKAANLISLRISDGMRINDDFIIGARAGINSWNARLENSPIYKGKENYDEEDREFLFTSGFIYQIREDIIFDASLGLNNYTYHEENMYINAEDTKKELFARIKWLEDEAKSIVALIEFKEDEIIDKKRFIIGRNTSYNDFLVAYSLELINQEYGSDINLHWGVEKVFRDNLIFRLANADDYTIYSNREEERRFSLSKVNYLNLGLGYKWNENITFDISYLPEVDLGFGDQAIKAINLNLSAKIEF